MNVLTHASHGLLIKPANDAPWKDRLLYAARSYVSLSPDSAVLIRSVEVGNRSFHVIESRKGSNSSLLALTLKIVKVISYIVTAFILPLGALIVNRLLISANNHSYYEYKKVVNNPQDFASFSAFKKAIVTGNVEEAKGIYTLENNVLGECVETPAYCACLSGDVKTMEWLVSIQGQQILDNTSLFTLSCRLNHLNLAQWLLDKQGNAILFQVNAEGFSPFESCCLASSDTTLSKELQTKAKEGATWLHKQGAAKGVFVKACADRKFDLAQKICKLFPDLLTQVDKQGQTPIQIAFKEDNLQIFKTLYEMNTEAALNVDLSEMGPHIAIYLHEKDSHKCGLSFVIDAFNKVSSKRQQEPTNLRDLCKTMSKATKIALLQYTNTEGKTLFETACKSGDSAINAVQVLYELSQEVNQPFPKRPCNSVAGVQVMKFLESKGYIVTS